MSLVYRRIRMAASGRSDGYIFCSPSTPHHVLMLLHSGNIVFFSRQSIVVAQFHRVLSLVISALSAHDTGDEDLHRVCLLQISTILRRSTRLTDIPAQRATDICRRPGTLPCESTLRRYSPGIYLMAGAWDRLSPFPGGGLGHGLLSTQDHWSTWPCPWRDRYPSEVHLGVSVGIRLLAID